MHLFEMISSNYLEVLRSNHGDENSEQISEWSLHIHNASDALRTDKTRLIWCNHRIGGNVFLSYEGLRPTASRMDKQGKADCENTVMRCTLIFTDFQMKKIFLHTT